MVWLLEETTLPGATMSVLALGLELEHPLPLVIVIDEPLMLRQSACDGTALRCSAIPPSTTPATSAPRVRGPRLPRRAVLSCLVMVCSPSLPAEPSTGLFCSCAEASWESLPRRPAGALHRLPLGRDLRVGLGGRGRIARRLGDVAKLISVPVLVFVLLPLWAAEVAFPPIPKSPLPLACAAEVASPVVWVTLPKLISVPVLVFVLLPLWAAEVAFPPEPKSPLPLACAAEVALPVVCVTSPK